jgi:hypothetical protein
MWRPSVFLIMLLSVAFASGCSEDEPAASIAEKRAPLAEVPVEILVKQRTTSIVPGSDGKLLLTIDDITDGQVMVTLATDHGTMVLPTRSLKPDESVDFKFGSVDYELKLRQLDNALVGEDSATFEIIVPMEGEISESERIELLIAAVQGLNDAKFIRNGTEYSATEAADHLRTKLEAAADDIRTANDFIEHIGSKSSTSGEPYQIKFADGKTVNAGDFLRQKLTKIK